MKPSFRIDEVAEMWDVSRRTIERLIRRGDLPCERKFGVRRISEEAVIEFRTRNATIPKLNELAIAKNSPEKTPEFLLEKLGAVGLNLTGQEFLKMRQPCVYAWVRDKKILYIGMSKAGLSRAIGSHHVLGLFEKTDELLLWYFATEDEAKQKERDLILTVKPVYNNLRI